MTRFNIRERQVRNVAVLDIGGQLRTVGSGAVLPDTIGRLLDEGRNRILLNLSGISTIDASGLGDLLEGHNTVNRRGGELKFLFLTQRVRELMVSMRLLSVCDIYENESKAIDSFKNPTSGPKKHPRGPFEDTLQ
jgi:anti-sigma B factor antagonist